MTRASSAALSPYVAGAGIGALSWLAFATAKKPIGVTTAFESTAAGLAQNIAPQAMHVNAYLAKRDEAPTIDFEWMLTAGIAVGSYLAARAEGAARGPSVPPLWARRFGPSPLLRYAGAFAGGALMMFGARMAKGCTSGHGISGNMQLAKSSWLFSAVFGSMSALTARALFGGGR
jgi:uncharacterized membrane protein YedE/YeeE